MAKTDVGHLGIMAYAAHFQWVKPRPPLADMIAVHLESTSGRVGETVEYIIKKTITCFAYIKRVQKFSYVEIYDISKQLINQL